MQQTSFHSSVLHIGFFVILLTHTCYSIKMIELKASKFLFRDKILFEILIE